MKRFRYFASAVFALVSAAPLFSAAETAAEPPLPASLRIPASDDGLPGAGPLRRGDWFQKIWNERRASWMNRTQQDQGAVVFYGDSITQGWGDNLGGSFPGLKLANRGIGGDTSRGLLVRLPEDVLALHPRGVVLLVGTNDLDDGASAETIASNVKLLIGELRKQNPALPIALCEIFPSSPEKNRPPEKIKPTNAALARVAEETHVELVPTWSVFAQPDGNAPLAEFPDLLHPNEAGYAKWAAALKPVLEKLGLLKP